MFINSKSVITGLLAFTLATNALSVAEPNNGAIVARNPEPQGKQGSGGHGSGTGSAGTGGANPGGSRSAGSPDSSGAQSSVQSSGKGEGGSKPQGEGQSQAAASPKAEAGGATPSREGAGNPQAAAPSKGGSGNAASPKASAAAPSREGGAGAAANPKASAAVPSREGGGNPQASAEAPSKGSENNTQREAPSLAKGAGNPQASEAYPPRGGDASSQRGAPSPERSAGNPQASAVSPSHGIEANSQREVPSPAASASHEEPSPQAPSRGNAGNLPSGAASSRGEAGVKSGRGRHSSAAVDTPAPTQNDAQAPTTQAPSPAENSPAADKPKSIDDPAPTKAPGYSSRTFKNELSGFTRTTTANRGNGANGVSNTGARDKEGPSGFGGFGGGSFSAPSGGFSGFSGFPHGATSVPHPSFPTSFPHSSAPPAPASTGCPQIWFKISSDLKTTFTTGAPGPGQCNDLARGAVRAAFHDCGSWDTSMGTSAGCDGSLYLAKEYTRSENAGLENIVPQLGQMAQSYGVGVADFLQFAAAHATVICPLGPTVKTMVGRKDRSTANPEGVLPNPHTDANTLIQNMADKGFSAPEVAAILGAHSTAKQFEFDAAHAGAALDDTPGVWDVRFYGEVLDNSAPFVLESDRVIAQDSRVLPTWKEFAVNQTLWNQAFADTMAKMALFGVDQTGLVDCTAALPPPQDSFQEPNGLSAVYKGSSKKFKKMRRSYYHYKH